MIAFFLKKPHIVDYIEVEYKWFMNICQAKPKSQFGIVETAGQETRRLWGQILP